MGINRWVGRQRGSRSPFMSCSRAIEPLEQRLLMAVWYVNDDGGFGTGGTSFFAPFRRLEEALAVAQAGDEIRVAGGVYRPTSGTDRDATFTLKSGVRIIGGYAGDIFLNRNPALYPTILSGDIGTPGVDTDNSRRVLSGANLSSSTVLDGVTVTGGFSDVSTGSGLSLTGSNMVINQVRFLRNTSVTGAAVYMTESVPTITNSVFAGNTAASEGGAIYHQGPGGTITNSIFVGNTATTGSAIKTRVSSLQVINSTFAYNTSQFGTSHVSLSNNPTLQYYNSIFWNNTASGGLGSVVGTTVVEHSTVEGGYGGTGNLATDPQFTGTLASIRGADGIWGTGDDDYTGLRLRSTSPAIDSGSNARLPVGISTDYDGAARFHDSPFSPDTGVGTSPIVDRGAFEFITRVVYVDDSATGANNGTSWANAFTRLQSALALGPGIDIRVGQGTYYARNAAGTVSEPFLISSGDLLLRGGFAGVGATDPNAKAGTTILSGEIGTTSATDNAQNVLRVDNTTSRTRIEDLTIRDGYNGTTLFLSAGAGLTMYSSSAVFNNISLINNTAQFGGGAFIVGGSPVFNNLHVQGNMMVGRGGAGAGLSIREGAQVTINNASIHGNIGKLGDVGGGIFVSNSTLTVNGGTFSGNIIEAGVTVDIPPDPLPTEPDLIISYWRGRGGGIAADSSTVNLNDVLLQGNIAQQAGGIYLLRSTANLTRTTLDSNATLLDPINDNNNGGGIFMEQFGTLNVTDSHFVENETLGAAIGHGGAIAVEGVSDVNIIGSTFSENRATAPTSVTNTTRGGDIYFAGRSLVIGDSTFSRSLARFGGSLALFGGTTNLNNLSFDRTTAATGGSIYGSAATLTARNLRIGRADTSDGAVSLSGGSATLRGMVLSANQQYGLFSQNANVTLANATIVGNEIGAIQVTGTAVSVRNSVLQGSIVGSVTAAFSMTTLAGTGNINAAPLFVRSPVYAAVATNRDAGDLRLVPASPGIDVGDNATLPADYLTDAGGVARVVNMRLVDGLNGNLAIVDMGAYETPDVPSLTTGGPSSIAESAGAVNLTLQLATPYGLPVALTLVPLITSPDGAIGGVDYSLSPAGGAWVIPAGQTLSTVTLNVVNDTFDERNETISFSVPRILSRTVTIVDDEFVTGDIDKDDDVDFDDLGALLGAYDSVVTPGTGADTNNDGTVDFDDLGLLLGNYGWVLPFPAELDGALLDAAPLESITVDAATMDAAPAALAPRRLAVAGPARSVSHAVPGFVGPIPDIYLIRDRMLLTWNGRSGDRTEPRESIFSDEPVADPGSADPLQSA